MSKKTESPTSLKSFAGRAPKKLDKQSKILKKPSVSKESALKKVSKDLAKKARSADRTREVGRAPRSGFREVGKLPDHHFKIVKVKRGLAGLGLFAGEDIKKREMIIEYIGNILDKEEADKKVSSQYLFEISRNKTIDGTPRWNVARYANHACEEAANAESDIKKGRVFIIATKDIKEGEEICYDYGEEFVDEHIKPSGCRCIAKKHSYGAKGVIVSN